MCENKRNLAAFLMSVIAGIFMFCGCSSVHGEKQLSPEEKSELTNLKPDPAMLEEWNCAKDNMELKILYKNKGGVVWPGYNKAVEVGGSAMWISADRKLDDIKVKDVKNLYMLFRVFNLGASHYGSVCVRTNKGSYHMKILCPAGKWSTYLIRIKDMKNLNWKKNNNSETLHIADGNVLKSVKIAQRCELGAESEKGSPEHSFIIGEFKILQGKKGEETAQKIIKQEMPDIFYKGKLNYLVSENANTAIWHAPSFARVFRDHPKPSKKDDAIKVSAAKDEWESFQIVVSPKEGIKNASAEISDLKQKNGKGIIKAENIDIYPVAYVHISVGPASLPLDRWYPDPLSRNKSVEIKKGENQPFWFSVHVPGNTPAGEYKGRISIKTDSKTSTVPVSLKVYGFAMPKVYSFRTNLQIWGDKKRIWEVAKLLGRYKLYDANRFLSLSLEQQKELIEKYGQNNVKLHGNMGHKSEGRDYKGAKFGTKEYENNVTDMIRRRIARLEKCGLPISAAFSHIWDEPMGSFEAVKHMAYIAKLIKSVNPEIKTYTSSGVFKGIDDGCIDFFTAGYNYNYLSKVDSVPQSLPYSFWRGAGNPLITSYMFNTRLWGIENWKFKMSGYFSWGITVWGSPRLPKGWNAWNDIGKNIHGMGVLNGCGLMIYPGGVPQSEPETPCYSIRLEVVRDGVEDYEYMRMLEDIRNKTTDPSVKKEVDKVMAEAMSMIVKYLKYDNDPGKFTKVRKKMAETIEKYHQTVVSEK